MRGQHEMPTASVVRSSQATPARRRGHLCTPFNPAAFHLSSPDSCSNDWGHLCWLVDQHYLLANPWKALVAEPDKRSQFDKRRSFTPTQWNLIREVLDTLGEEGARPRLRFALLLLYGTGLRLSEVVSARVEDLHHMVLSDGSTSVRLRVVGKGGKERFIPVARALLDEMGRYFKTRGWNDIADAPAKAFLLARAADESVLPMGLEYEVFGGISAGVLARQLKAFFHLVAKRCAESDPAAAERLRKASTHWLRHTFGTRVASITKDVVDVRDMMGHASVATTSGYLDGDDIAQRDAVEKLMAMERERKPSNSVPRATSPPVHEKLLATVENALMVAAASQATGFQPLEEGGDATQSAPPVPTSLPSARHAAPVEAPRAGTLSRAGITRPLASAAFKVATVVLTLRVDAEQPTATRRAIDDIEQQVLLDYGMRQLGPENYELQVLYGEVDDLDDTVCALLAACRSRAADHGCSLQPRARCAEIGMV